MRLRLRYLDSLGLASPGWNFATCKLSLTGDASSYTSICMPKTSRALIQLPPATAASLEKLGADLAVARLRRKESLKTWAKRMGVSVPTLQRLESGDPTVAVGIVATALWLIRRDGELAELASPEHDLGALERDVRKAVD
jgi:hypothetical protein